MQTQATNRTDRLTRHAGSTSTPEGTQPAGATTSLLGSDRGPSTDFIITAEAFEALAESDPNRARYEIVLRLYESCYTRVYSFLRRSVSPDVADDLVQETFLRLLGHNKLERMSISISYLFRIAQNLVRRRYNSAVRRRAVLDEGFKYAVDHSCVSDDPSGNLIAIESEDLGRAIEHLSPREHEVLRLTICEGLSYSTVARVFGVPVSTVNNWKHRALVRLREFIDAANPDVQQHKQHRNQSTNRRGSAPGDVGKQAASSGELGAADTRDTGGLKTRTAASLPSRAAG